jgi:hypothetical protein
MIILPDRVKPKTASKEIAPRGWLDKFIIIHKTGLQLIQFTDRWLIDGRVAQQFF